MTMSVNDENEASSVNNEDEASIEEKEGDKRVSPAMVEKFVIRLPNGLRSKIRQLSEQNRRSMNAEIIMVLEKHIQQCLLSSNLEELAEGLDAAHLTDKQLSEKLESLPPEKKEALLELLG